MRSLFLFMLFLTTAHADCIDFWNEGCREKLALPQQIKVSRKKTENQKSGKQEKKEKQKKEDKEKLLKELFKKSMNWTPENLSPLEQYVSLHPEDERAVYYLRKYLMERQIKACYLERGLALLPTDYCDRMKELWKAWVEGKKEKEVVEGIEGIEEIEEKEGVEGTSTTSTTSTPSTTSKTSNYDFLFFFSYTCPHCQKVLPVVLEKLKDYNLIPIPATQENAEKFQEWKVKTVPTLIAYDRKKKKAYRLSGFNEKALEYFLRKLEEK